MTFFEFLEILITLKLVSFMELTVKIDCEIQSLCVTDGWTDEQSRQTDASAIAESGHLHSKLCWCPVN